MARTEEHFQFSVCHQTELASVLRGHHVVITSTCHVGQLQSVKGYLQPLIRERKQINMTSLLLACKSVNNVLVGHVPIEISNLCYHFLHEFPPNKIDAVQCIPWKEA